MITLAILNLTFIVLLIAATFVEDWRDGLWFFGTAGKIPDVDPVPPKFWLFDKDNIFWHTIKPLEAILMWLCGVFGCLMLYSVWESISEPYGYITAFTLIVVNLSFVWGIRVRFHLWFLDLARKHHRKIKKRGVS